MYQRRLKNGYGNGELGYSRLVIRHQRITKDEGAIALHRLPIT
ncbi:hypothetical protein [Coleofasciculus sp. FACHB-1120]|nr:hypothetical protein [Coleofasciculus sp. FACHB-1120]